MDRAPALLPVKRGLFHALKTTTFRSLRSRNYRLYFFGQIVSFTGSWMQSAALMWLVFDATNDPVWPAILLVGQVGPTILLGTLGGALADRISNWKLIYFTQIAFMMNSLALLASVASGYTEPWMFFAFNLCGGIIQSLDLPARLAFVPDLVPPEDLINAISLNSLLFNSARAIGPAFAGLFFLLANASSDLFPGMRPVILGALGCFAMNSLSYVAVLFALKRMRVKERNESGKPRGSIWEGFRYIRQRPILGCLIAITGTLCVFGWPTLTLFPAYTRQALGHAEKEYSLLVSALGLGALVAALATATYGTIARRGFMLSLGAGCVAMGMCALSLATAFLPATAGASLAGFGLVLFLSTGQSTLQLSVPPEMRGRVMALWAMMISASAPIGHLAAGFAAKVYPVQSVYAVLTCGVGLSTLATIAVYLTRGWKS